MLAIVGFVIVIGAVIGGFLMEGGKLLVLFQPAEFLIIGGAALGSLLVASPVKVVKTMIAQVMGTIGSPPTKESYTSLLVMLYEIFQAARKDGLVAMEAHVEKPDVADIDRGGVFAQIIGTLECLEQNQRAQIRGCIINRFRGDIHLFKEGVHWIEEKTEKPVFGVLPWYNHIQIEPEDSVVIENPKKVAVKESQNPVVAVIRLPHISNFTDFDPLLAINNLDMYFLEKAQSLAAFRAVILPGSKNTRFDLNWIQTSGWAKALSEYLSSGGYVLGICGGYQMMGKAVHDPTGLEGQPGSSEGLGLLPIETTLKAPKTTTLTHFSWDGQPGAGYEIHMGETIRTAGTPLFSVTERNQNPCRDEDGCESADSKIMGTYIHGLFNNPTILKSWLNRIGLNDIDVSNIGGIEARNREYDLLAEHFQKHVDVDRIVKMVVNRV